MRDVEPYRAILGLAAPYRDVIARKTQEVSP
jgi:hypothetical protein